MYVMAHVCFYVCFSDCVGVCCIAAVVEDSVVFLLWSVKVCCMFV